jgi:DeoR/GlpR family transcriptional regulator of sugar metabolism
LAKCWQILCFLRHGGFALKLERRGQITELINRQKTVTNAELMERFGISIETVRRDLDYLEQQGVLRKVYGGAVVNVSLNSEPEYASRSRTNHEEKMPSPGRQQS